MGTSPKIEIKPEVLVVDDNPADSDLTSEALSRCSSRTKFAPSRTVSKP